MDEFKLKVNSQQYVKMMNNEKIVNKSNLILDDQYLNTIVQLQEQVELTNEELEKAGKMYSDAILDLEKVRREKEHLRITFLEVNQKTLDGIAELNEMLETQRRQIESLKKSVTKLKQNDSKLKVTIAYNTEKEVDHKYHNAQLKDNLDRFKYPSSMSFPKLDRDLLLVYCVISNHLFPDLNKSRLDKIIAAGKTGNRLS